MKIIKSRSFANGKVYALSTQDGFPVETTDTFLPFYTKDCINSRSNALANQDLGSRKERWMIGVSVMSGCPIGCKFCATGQLKKWRKLTVTEIVEQINFVLCNNPNENFGEAKEHKINYTRMGEPFLNIEEVKKTIEVIDKTYPNTHHYVSTIGIKGSDFSWVKDNITLQISLHSLREESRNDLIPHGNKMTIEELGQIRTQSNLKTTVNLTLVDKRDFDISLLQKYFDPRYFFIKLSPLNPNCISQKHQLSGVISQTNQL
ncbi:MAG TPA: radical SAM protein [Ignavibacteriales bacterium]|nr:radical SAM protein [Ignavibacteriales bacterium]